MPRRRSSSCLHPGPCSAACRARRFRARNREAAQAADRARRDERRQAEVRARAYVAKALSRGTIAPPTRCDACGRRAERLHPWHPDPHTPREVAWLCAEDRKAAPASGLPIALGWVWPGATSPRRRPREGRLLPLSPSWVEAADERVRAAIAANPTIAKDRRVVAAWCDGFFDAAGSAFRERLYAVALRGGDPLAFSPYLSERVEGLLRWWATDERRRRSEALAREIIEAEARVVEPRYGARVRLRRSPAVTAAPSSSAPVRPLVVLSQDEVLRRLDEAMAEFERQVEKIVRRDRHGR